ncbi:MAG: ArsR family transcriptional regulator [Pseudomonadota bacterium]
MSDVGPATIRQRILNLLAENEMTARELSQALGIREREVLTHLEHAARTAKCSGRKLRILPFACLSCGHAFSDRTKFGRPGRCPKCKETHIQEPRFTLK